MKKSSSFYLPIISHEIDMPYVDKPRRIRVLLPKDYDSNSDEQYPVLYMHDGQNIFYSRESFSGYSWKIIPLLKYSSDLPKLIVVGIDNAEEERLDEYAPWSFDNEASPESYEHHALGIAYAEWVVNHVKPFIDTQYRTKPERQDTLLAGSSLGGLITAYMGSAYPDVFGSLGIFSLASWLSEEAFLDFIAQHPLDRKTKVYIQVGTKEGNGTDRTLTHKNVSQAYIDSSLYYYQTLIAQGHPMDKIWLRILADEQHFEKYWADHFGEYLNFSFS